MPELNFIRTGEKPDVIGHTLMNEGMERKSKLRVNNGDLTISGIDNQYGEITPCVVEGEIRCTGNVIIKNGAIVEGKIFCNGDINIEKGATIKSGAVLISRKGSVIITGATLSGGASKSSRETFIFADKDLKVERTDIRNVNNHNPLLLEGLNITC